MNNIIITKVTLDRVTDLQSISKSTFSETFAPGNSEENLAQYLTDAFSEEQLLSELTNPGSEFYFALVGNDIIGYLKINFGASQTEIQEDHTAEIERIYVLKNFQGKRVGQLLYEKALHLAEQANANYLWLGVWEENQKAIRFYQKNGFVPFDKHVFKLGNDEQTDIMMKLKLAKNNSSI